jgi:signal transduction histidine kinase
MQIRFKQKILIEYILFLITGIGIYIWLTSIDVFEKFYHFSRNYENYELDEFATSILTVSFLSIIMLIRRNSQTLKLNKKYKQSKIELEESLALKNKLFSIIGHDLRTPFNSLIGYTELIKYTKDDLNPKHEQYIDIISATSRNTYEILTNLLDWAKDETSGTTLQKENLCLKDVIDENIEILRPVAEFKNIDIKTSYNKDTAVFCDQTTMSAVVRNLLSNAIKFTPKKGLVKISSETNSFHILISIEDNGIGIPKETVQKIHNGEQLNSTTGTADEKGTGLGLALSQKFLSYNSSELLATSTAGKGSCFTIKIPKTKQ